MVQEAFFETHKIIQCLHNPRQKKALKTTTEKSLKKEYLSSRPP